MIGRVYELGRRSPIAPVFWFLPTLGLVIGSVATKNPHLAIAAALPFALFLRSLMPASQLWSLEVRPDGLFERNSDRLIPYSDIQCLRIGGAAPSIDARISNGPIDVLTDSDAFRIPRSPDSADLYKFLIGRLPPGGSFEPPDKLQKFLQQELAEFSDDMVWAYAGRNNFRKPRTGPSRSGFVALGLTIWIAAGIVMGQDGLPWLGCGFLGLILTGLFALLAKSGTASDGRFQKLAPNTGLVISPRGIALCYADVSGKLKWDEIRKIEMANPRSFTVAHVAQGLSIVVAGSTIQVPDIFEKPIAKIQQQLLLYWQQG
jgi:hypothetical protein